MTMSRWELVVHAKAEGRDRVIAAPNPASTKGVER
jgi:hypothetical protein